MRSLIISLAVVIVCVCSQFGLAFSPIWNVNSWNTERLSEVGISVRPYSHKLQTEDPPREWVQITFDSSQLTHEQPVLMTAHLVSEREEIATVRAERDNQDAKNVSLRLAVQDTFLGDSYLDIVIWDANPDGGHSARGYRLSLRRIVEVARKDALKNAKNVDN